MPRKKTDWTEVVWLESTATGSDLLVLLALADSANEDGHSAPDTEELAIMTKMSRRSVQRSLKQLSDDLQIELIDIATAHKPARFAILGSATQLCRRMTTRVTPVDQTQKVHANSVYNDTAMSLYAPKGKKGTKNGTNGNTSHGDAEDNEFSPFDPRI